MPPRVISQAQLDQYFFEITIFVANVGLQVGTSCSVCITVLNTTRQWPCCHGYTMAMHSIMSVLGSVFSSCMLVLRLYVV